jgi:hypothetical protein
MISLTLITHRKAMMMDKQRESSYPSEREAARANASWEPNGDEAGSADDPSYDRATAALRRWVDGMEAALSKRRK